jgi:hypothetical protein
MADGLHRWAYIAGYPFWVAGFFRGKEILWDNEYIVALSQVVW